MTRMHRYRLVFLFVLMAGCLPVQASIETYRFDTPDQERRYYRLIHELRCLVCRNQNLADSNAQLAKDLRRQIYLQTMAGKSREQIIDYMAQRYGEFILYHPPFNAHTALLWLFPPLLAFAGFMLARHIQKRAHQERDPHA